MNDDNRDKDRDPKWNDEEERETHNLMRTQTAPRKKHGTRVTFNFVCGWCGKNAVLDYRPKIAELDDILCEDCMEKNEDSARWKIVREKKKMEEGLGLFPKNCDECGREEMLTRPTRRGVAYVCQRCKQQQATPNKERLEGAEKVNLGLKVRRKKKEPEVAQDEVAQEEVAQEEE